MASVLELQNYTQTQNISYFYRKINIGHQYAYMYIYLVNTANDDR
jgi:hypothetical protein